MAKKRVVSGYILEVHPSIIPWGDLEKRVKESLSTCEAIQAEIKRHVDDVEASHIEPISHDECEHCGAVWTEDSTDYNGGCCAEDQDAYEAAHLNQIQGEG